MKKWESLCGNVPISFNNSVFLSENDVGDANFALGYYMLEMKALDSSVKLSETLEFYFQNCSIEADTRRLSVLAATLATGGVCPVTGEKIFKSDDVKNCLSLLSSSGLFNFSGEYAFMVGLPSKSGISGGLLVVVPNVMGIAIFSPRVDSYGNSCGAVTFCKILVENYSLHQYDSLVNGALSSTMKKDPRNKTKSSDVGQGDGAVYLCYAASVGDMRRICELVAGGVNVNLADYDGRTG